MLKNKINLPFSITVMFLLLIAVPAMAGHPYDKNSFTQDAKSTEAQVIKSGDGVTCSNDFALENNNGKDVEALIILGGQPFSKVHIPQHSVKMYDLRKNSMRTNFDLCKK